MYTNHMQCTVRDVYIYIQVGGIPTPLKNDGVSSSVGMMTFHSIPNFFLELIKFHGSSHQPISH